MQYFADGKGWKYHLKSGLMSFASAFSLVFAWEIYTTFGSIIHNFTPEQITVASVAGFLVALARIALFSIVKVLYNYIISFKK